MERDWRARRGGGRESMGAVYTAVVTRRGRSSGGGVSRTKSE